MAFRINSGVLAKWIPESDEHIAVIPDTVKSIGIGAFEECEELQEVIIPPTVTRIAKGAFVECKNLHRLTIPAGVAIHIDAFDECGDLKFLCITPGSKSEITDDYRNNGYFSLRYLRELRIAEGITAIVDGFMGITELKQIHFPESLEVITGFSLCKGLEELHFPKTLKQIGNNAFYCCTGLRKITIPDNVQVKDGAFMGCSGLKRVTLGKNVKLGKAVFSGCASLEEPLFSFDRGKKLICLPPVGEEYHMPDDITAVDGAVFHGRNDLRHVVWGKGAKQVTTEAFHGVRNLSSVILPEGVTKILSKAFWECRRLKKVELPNSLIEMGSYVFHSCIFLREINLPPQLKKIGAEAFHDCERLISLTIPASVQTIEGYAFVNGPKRVIFLGDPQFLGEHPFGKPTPDVCRRHIIYAAEGTNIEKYAKENGFRFRVLGDTEDDDTLPEPIADIAESEKVTFVVPGGVTMIDASTTSDKDTLEKIVLPTSATEIAEDAFVGCNSLQELVVPIPIEFSYSAFPVPCELKGWKLVLIPSDQCNDGIVTWESIPHLSGVRTLEIGKGFTRVDDVWNEHLRINTLILPEGLEELGIRCFADCEWLIMLDLPRSLKKVKSLAFEKCIGLVEVRLSRNTEVAPDAFAGCNDIDFVYYEDE